MPALCRVTANYCQPQSERALFLERGQSVLRVEPDRRHVGWWWCVDRWGNAGWVHESALGEDDYRFIALEDFDSHELCVQVGEVLRLLETRSGRARCINAAGEVGWLPMEVLEIALLSEQD